jgi:hypothetical protein
MFVIYSYVLSFWRVVMKNGATERCADSPTRNPTPSMGSDECSFSEKMVGPGSFSENGLKIILTSYSYSNSSVAIQYE